MDEYEDKKDDIQEESEDLEQVEDIAEVETEMSEDIAEDETETSEDAIEDETDDSLVVEDHAKEDESKWTEVYSRLDSLELRIGELMVQGGVDNSVLEDETEISDIELENNNWYKRNSMMNNY